MILDENSASFTNKRMDLILGRYGAKMTPKYSKAYIAYMTPSEYLSLTTTDLARIESESRKLDIEELKKRISRYISSIRRRKWSNNRT